MVTGRRIEAATGGHGVTWNDDRRRPGTVQAAAGESVESVFTVVDDAGALRGLLREQDASSRCGTARGRWPPTRRRSSRTTRRWSGPSSATSGAPPAPSASCTCPSPTSSATRRASWARPTSAPSRRADRRVGSVIDALRTDPRYAGHTTVILTADHGGRGEGHYDATSIARLPRPVHGVGQRRGPGHGPLRPQPRLRRPRPRPDDVRRRPPVRNGDGRQPRPRPPRAARGPRAASTTPPRTSTSARLTLARRSDGLSARRAAARG